MLALPPVNAVLLLALVFTALYFDLRFRRIPNWLNVAGFALGIALNSFLFLWEGFKLATIGFGVAFAIYFVLYALHAVGAGDVKLMAAVGAIVGWVAWVPIFFIAVIIQAVAGIILVTARGRLKRTLWNVGFIMTELAHRRVPYLRREELDVRSEKAARLPHCFGVALSSAAVSAYLLLRQ